MQCHICGSPISNDDRFCGKCGARLDNLKANEQNHGESMRDDAAQAAHDAGKVAESAYGTASGWVSSVGQQVKEFTSSKEVSDARAAAKKTASKAARMTAEAASGLAQSAKEFAASDEVAAAKASAQKAASRVADTASKTAADVAKSARDFAQSDTVANAVSQAETTARRVADKAANSEIASAVGKTGMTKAIAAVAAVVVVAVIGFMAFRGPSGEPGHEPSTPNAGGASLEPSAQAEDSMQDEELQHYGDPIDSADLTEDEKQQIRNYLASFTYDDFVADLHNSYPLLEIDEIKSDQLRECYFNMMLDQMEADLQSTQAVKTSGNTATTQHLDSALLSQLIHDMDWTNQQRMDDICSKLNVEINDFAYYEAEEGELTTEGKWIVAGFVQNNSDKALAECYFAPYAHVYYADRDEYGDVTNSGDEWVCLAGQNVLGFDNGIVEVKGIGVKVSKDGITAYDLGAGERRAFVASLSVERNNVEALTKDMSPDCYATEFSSGDVGGSIMRSELMDMSADGITLADHVQLDENWNSYEAYQGQIEVTPKTLTIDDDGYVKGFTCSIKNNTGFNLSKARVTVCVFDQSTLQLIGQKATNDLTYYAEASSSLSAFGSGKEVDDVEFGNNGTNAGLFHKIPLSGAESKEAGTYSPQELGVVVQPTSITYDLDIAKNERENLLPEDWETRSIRYKQNEQYKEFLISLVESALDSCINWANEHPEEAIELSMKLAGYMTDSLIDEFVSGL